MALNKLYYIYGLDTSCFYTDEENRIEKKVLKARHIKSLINERLKKNIKKLKKLEEGGQRNNELLYWERKTKKQLSFLNQYIGKYKVLLKDVLAKNVKLTREVRTDKILDKEGNPSLRRRVSIFDSNLTRCFGLKEREFNTEIIIVKVYFFDVAKSIVHNGFYMNGHKYVFFSSSAGQIRTKKLVAVREDLLNQHWNTLTAGLTIGMINAQGGMNINKYLAYLALSNSATDIWEDFDIDRCIVVEDFENTIVGTVDFIDEKTYEIERKTLPLPFTQTDGCGMILPCLSDRNFMVRLPWTKGLLAKFDFVKFIKENNASPVVKDIYGDEHDIIEENIQIILSKSQFKMWKFYSNWHQYKDNFKKYNCTAGKCNVEEDVFPDSVINYQMIQTLSDLSDDEIRHLAVQNDEDIQLLATDMHTMLKVFGVTSWNTNKNAFQKCLEKYPELLSDAYSRQTLRDIKTKLENDLWSARFAINGKYTFVIPDLYAFCERLFLHKENSQGLLRDGEVCCKLFQNGEKLDCLRSPHLYIEHPIRVNKTDISWFETNAIYVSCRDLISRIVMCDYDGDKLLVTNNKTLINAAERNIFKFDVVPLFYNMGKANAEILTPDTLFKGLLLAYNGGNIGAPSNDITKIWNSGVIDEEALKVVKWLVMEVNFIIDYSKTLYKPKRPDWVNDNIVKYTKEKAPYFFQFAKKKSIDQVRKETNCVVDRIKSLYSKRKLNFNFKIENIGRFDYKTLMHNPKTEFKPEVAEKFKDVTSNLCFNHVDDRNMYNYLAVYEKAKEDILDFGYDEFEIIDSIILNLFVNRKTPMKKAFWTLFGDVVYQNICNNIAENYIQCGKCHKRFYRNNTRQIYCKKCQGYQKKKTKTIVCCDCKTKFKAKGNSRRLLCDKCIELKRKEHNRKGNLRRNKKVD